MNHEKRKKVLCPIERRDKSTYWMSVGNAWRNVDGSTNVYLDVLPQNGRLQIRDLSEQDLERIKERSASKTDAGTGGLPF
jgi:hypothetical protein